MEKIKVGLFLDTFYPTYDGVINYMHNLAVLLSDKCDFTVFCPGMQPDEFYKQFPYKIIRCKSKNIWKIPYEVATPKSDQKFIDELNQTKLDLVHVHSPFSVGKMGYQYALKNKIPIITTFHTQFKKDIYHVSKSFMVTSILLRNIMHWVNKSNEVWTNNYGMINLLKKTYKCKAEINLVRNFTTHSTVKYTDRMNYRDSFNHLHKIDNNTKLLLFTGRLIRQKNIFFLVKVAKILKKMNFPFKMIFVGNGIDEKSLKSQVIRSKLDKEVIFLGKLQDINELEQIYAISDLFVFPSKYDASSLVQIEAAVQFLPTLFLENSITSSLVEDNWTGFICKDNPRDYAQKIIEIFNSKPLYDTVKEHCHTLVRTWDQTKNEIYDGYMRVIRDYKLKNQ